MSDQEILNSINKKILIAAGLDDIEYASEKITQFSDKQKLNIIENLLDDEELEFIKRVCVEKYEWKEDSLVGKVLRKRKLKKVNGRN